MGNFAKVIVSSGGKKNRIIALKDIFTMHNTTTSTQSFC